MTVCMKGSIAVILLAVISFACGTTTDPRQGGFIGGLYGISSGAYENRLEQRKEELALQQNQKRELENQSRTLEKEAEARDTALAVEQQRCAAMDEELRRIQADLRRLNLKSANQKNEVAMVSKEIDELRQRLQDQQSAISKLDRTDGPAVQAERYTILVKERERLADEYLRLLEYSKSLSDAAR